MNRRRPRECVSENVMQTITKPNRQNSERHCSEVEAYHDIMSV